MPKRLGPKRLGAETSRGRNGLVPKRPVTDNLPQDNQHHEKLALRQFAPDSEDNSSHFVSLNSNAQLNDLGRLSEKREYTHMTIPK